MTDELVAEMRDQIGWLRADPVRQIEADAADLLDRAVSRVELLEAVVREADAVLYHCGVQGGVFVGTPYIPEVAHLRGAIQDVLHPFPDLSHSAPKTP